MTVQVRELAAWGFDDFAYRPALDAQRCNAVSEKVRHRQAFKACDPRMEALTAEHADELARHALRRDLLDEVGALQWSMAVIDLRRLLAFQRRLSLRPNRALAVPIADDWDGLIEFAFGPAKPVRYDLTHGSNEKTITLISTDPNLHLRRSGDLVTPWLAHAGSPFLEVARYRDRWFLRDGYHRAYALLLAGVFAVPALIVEATTLAELGADQTRFFPEATLLSQRPPCLADFLDDALSISYERPALAKIIRVTIEESFAPAAEIGESH